jgi:hypothetical protein
MDPLITNATDPALLRVVEKRGHDRERFAQPKRAPNPAQENEAAPPVEEAGNEEESVGENPKHTLDDLA